MADILIVDDDKIMIEIISEILVNEDHDVRFSINGKAGLEEISKCIPKLVVLDMYMPEMDGYAVAKILRANPATASLPILAVTSLDTLDDYSAAHEAGCNAFVSKPLQPAAFIEAVNKLLNEIA